MDCVVYGVGSSYVYEVHEILRRKGWGVRGLVANMAGVPRPEGIGGVVDADDMPAEWLAEPVVLALVTPGNLQHVAREARQRGFRRFPALVDPTAVVAASADIADGVVVNAAAVIGARTRVGRFASINRSVSVGHHVEIAEYGSLGPGCVLGGEVRIDRGAFVGAGATVLPGVTVGSNAVAGAGSVVVRDVAANSVVVGNPARVIRTANPGYNGVAVIDEPEDL